MEEVIIMAQLIVKLLFDSKEDKAFMDYIYGTELMDTVPKVQYEVDDKKIYRGKAIIYREYTIETPDTSTIYELGYYWKKYQTDKNIKLKNIFGGQ